MGFCSDCFRFLFGNKGKLDGSRSGRLYVCMNLKISHVVIFLELGTNI